MRSNSGATTREAVQSPERGATHAESPEETTQGLLPPPDGGGGRLVVPDARKSKKGFFTSVKDKLKHGRTKKTVKSTVAGGVVPGDSRAGADGGEEDEEEEEEHLSKKELELLKREEEERKHFLEDIGYGEGMMEVEFPPEVRSEARMRSCCGHGLTQFVYSLDWLIDSLRSALTLKVERSCDPSSP